MRRNAVAMATKDRTTTSMHANGDIIVQATGLTKRFGQHVAVNQIDFSVQRGEVFGFLGPNGSGKSTTIGMMLGLVTPSAGSIELFGMGNDRRDKALNRVGAIIETPAFYPFLSGRDNLRAMGELRGGIPSARIEEVLATVGLTSAAHRPFKNYSLGMKQRLGIGWTLLHDPELLVLDEPTNGLDPAGMAEIRRLILQLAREGKTIFLSSHLLNEVEQVCDRVVIIQRGSVIAEGLIDELVHGNDRLRIGTNKPEAAQEIIEEVGLGHTVEITTGGVLVSGTDLNAAALNRLLVERGIDVWELTLLSSSLEQVFLDVTGNGETEPAPVIAQDAEQGAATHDS